MVRPSNRKRNQKKLQSAMEYLTTYGWALLVIAVVLVALFELGIFNSTNFAPRAQPGACQVSRPYGPYSNYLMKLAGVCTGVLPEYVTILGTSGNIIAGPLTGMQQISSSSGAVTITEWVFMPQVTGGSYFAFYRAPSGINPYVYATPTGVLTVCVGPFCSMRFDLSSNIIPNQWLFCVVELNNTAAKEYIEYSGTIINSQSITPMWGSNVLPPGNLQIGNFYGSVANVQIYNITLSANEIQTQYIKGIGGAPIKPENLVGWWPLNGNTKDYSGNGNDGTATNIAYTSSWINRYTPP